MAKLHFQYGVMASGKTLELLKLAHNYEQQGREVIIFNPVLNTRDGKGIVKSRMGVSHVAHELSPAIKPVDTEPLKSLLENPLEDSIIIVDESQFLTAEQVDDLAVLVDDYGLNVWCFGLLVDAFSSMFLGSKRLLEVADKVEELRTVCRFCDRKATQQLRIVDNKVVKEGAQIQVGGDESYLSVCRHCWKSYAHGDVYKF